MKFASLRSYRRLCEEARWLELAGKHDEAAEKTQESVEIAASWAVVLFLALLAVYVIANTLIVLLLR